MHKSLVLAAAAGGLAVYLAPALFRAWRKQKAKVKVTYFNIAGLGEPIRLSLALGGKSFEDYRFAERAEFMALKPSLKFGQVPCMHVDGQEVFQSAAILRYIGKVFTPSLYPADPVIAAEVDGLVDQLKDAMVGRSVFKYRERFGFPLDVLSDQHAAAAEANWTMEVLPRHLSYFEAALSKSSTQWLAGTSEPTMADVMFATTFVDAAKDYGRKLPSSLEALVRAFYALPAVVAFKSSESK